MRYFAHLCWLVIGLNLLLNACKSIPDRATELQNSHTSDYNCRPIPDCDALTPDPGEVRPFKVRQPNGGAWHYGHDQFFREGDAQWILGKFSYGNQLRREALRAEEVDIWLLRGCGESWEKIGTSRTTAHDLEHAAIAGIDDDAGRIYFPIPKDKELGVGRHRVRMQVAGDHSAAELFIEVLPKNSRLPLFISDIDGTLTTAEFAELGGTLTGKSPDANEGAAQAFQALVAKGYRPYYLTARPEHSVQRTRDFIKEKGFPAGIISVSRSPILGLSGNNAIKYKSDAILRLKNMDLRIDFAFGNTLTDAQAYERADLAKDSRFFFKYEDKTFGGHYFHSYLDLNNFDQVVNTCF